MSCWQANSRAMFIGTVIAFVVTLPRNIIQGFEMLYIIRILIVVIPRLQITATVTPDKIVLKMFTLWR